MPAKLRSHLTFANVGRTSGLSVVSAVLNRSGGALTRARVVRAGLAASLLAVSVSSAVLVDSARAATTPFFSTGAEQTFTVPAGVTTVHVVATGGGGGTGGGAGGVGAQVSGDLSVTPGQALFIEVAGNGQSGTSGGAGGFNGGAAGAGGGGGAGASDVRTLPRSAGLSPDRRLIVAAGGGGGAASGSSTGGAGGSAGSAGAEGAGMSGNFGGGAGTSSAGGTGGIGNASNGLDGQLGLGGDSGSFNVPGGGGGGGFFGGGGGSGGINLGGGGGGGGSSLKPLGGTIVLSVQQPQVQITYTLAAPPVTPTAPTSGKASLRRLARTVTINLKTGKGTLSTKCNNVPADKCVVRLLLKVPASSHATAGAKKKKRFLKIGTAKGTIAGGKTGKIRFKLNRKGRSLLKKRRSHKLKVTAVGTSKNRAGAATAINRKLTLKGKGGKK